MSIIVFLIILLFIFFYFFFFFFNDTATTEIYTLSLHDALPISGAATVPITALWLAGIAIEIPTHLAPATTGHRGIGLGAACAAGRSAAGSPYRRSASGRRCDRLRVTARSRRRTARPARARPRCSARTPVGRWRARS